MDTPEPVSIQKRLHQRVLLVSLILVAVFLLIAYKNVQYETQELFDAQLARSARLILSLAQAEIKGGMHDMRLFQKYLEDNRLQAARSDGEEDEETTVDGHHYETKLAFAVVSDAGEVLLHSYNSPEQLASVSQRGFSTLQINNYKWRLFRLENEDGSMFCVTAERIDVRNDLIYKISSDLVMLFVSLLATLALVMWFAIGSGLTPLRLLAEQIQRRNADNLSEVDIKNVPTEVRAIIEALNKLFKRLSDALTRERNITSDAAHELRTPLAAVKLHAELALSANNDEEKNESLQSVMQGVERSTHMVEQLLKLARLEPHAMAQQFEPLKLAQLVDEVVHEQKRIADSEHIILRSSLSDDGDIMGDAGALRLMLRNLVDNAIRYTQEGGEVQVSLERRADNICLIVSDNGPGISAQNRERIFERFYRVENHAKTGCGIGMAIVARVCEMHGAEIELSDPAQGTGLVVTICFPI